MSAIARTVDQYIEREIANAGYLLAPDAGGPPSSFEWSLRGEDRDGVLFYGRLEGEALLGLAERLMGGKARAAARRAVRKGFSLALRRRGELRDVEVLWGSGPEGSPRLTDLEWEAFHELRALVGADAMKLRIRLENEGYAILEAAQPGSFRGRFGLGQPALLRRYRAGNYTAEIRVVEDPDFDPYSDVQQNPHGFVRGMAAGRNVVYGVEARIFAHGEGRKRPFLAGRKRLRGVADRADLRRAPSVALLAFADAKEAAKRAVAGRPGAGR